MFPHLAVSEAIEWLQRLRIALLDDISILLDESLLDHQLGALIDPVVQFLARADESDFQGIEVRIGKLVLAFVNTQWLPGLLVDLQPADDPDCIVRMNIVGQVGIDLLELVVKVVRILLVFDIPVFFPNLVVGLRHIEDPVHEHSDIQPGPTHDDGDTPSVVNLTDRLLCHLDILGDIGFFV
jgi:hypothetical protein